MPDPNEVIEYLGVPLTRREKDNLVSGMASPRVRRMSPGTKLYRVADASRSRNECNKVDGEAGAWWVGQKAFKKMMRYCVQEDQLDRGLGYAAREAAAVLFGWSACDLLVEAYLARNVKVFYGKGNPQTDDKGVTFSGWSDVDQWFIPGLAERVASGDKKHVKLSDKGRSVLNVYRTVSLRSVMNDARSFR